MLLLEIHYLSLMIWPPLDVLKSIWLLLLMVLVILSIQFIFQSQLCLFTFFLQPIQFRYWKWGLPIPAARLLPSNCFYQTQSKNWVHSMLWLFNLGLENRLRSTFEIDPSKPCLKVFFDKKHSKPSQTNIYGKNSLSLPRHSFFSWYTLFKIWDWKLSPSKNGKGGRGAGWYCGNDLVECNRSLKGNWLVYLSV